MKKEGIWMKRITVFLLAAVLAAALQPAGVRAQETGTENHAEQTDITKEPGSTALESDAGDGVNTIQDGAVNTLQDDTANTIQDDPANTIQNDGVGGTEPTGEDGEDKTPEEPENPADLTVVIEPISSGHELYGSLSQFLSLSAERFQIYTVGFVSGMTQQPAVPDEAVSVALAVPSDYDLDRTVVSRISLGGTTPVRTELAFTYQNGEAQFETAEAGIYAVMEKRPQVQLPPSLEPTEKVEKLELNKKYPTVTETSEVSSVSKKNASVVNPQTGDDNTVMVWGIITAVAAAAVAAAVVVIIIIRKRRK